MTLKIQKDVYLSFIDYTKVFDRARHDEIITQLTQLKIDGRDLQVIKNMHALGTNSINVSWWGHQLI